MNLVTIGGKDYLELEIGDAERDAREDFLFRRFEEREQKMPSRTEAVYFWRVEQALFTLTSIMLIPEPADDWTAVDGRSNCSPAFEGLVAEVAWLLRNSSHALINGDVDGVARLIMAHLAHKHGLVPGAHA